ncbi:hypothetical protein CHU98_g3377 [Xylaria longipes]|nr:hypothetical protein CHU98_g3377 [Xylaria longipes]
MCKDAAVKSDSIPSYTPRTNPIEEFFGQVKAQVSSLRLPWIVFRRWRNNPRRPTITRALPRTRGRVWRNAVDAVERDQKSVVTPVGMLPKVKEPAALELYQGQLQDLEQRCRQVLLQHKYWRTVLNKEQTLRRPAQLAFSSKVVDLLATGWWDLKRAAVAGGGRTLAEVESAEEGALWDFIKV